MVEARLSVKHYRREHYSTLFDQRTGFFARVEDSGYAEPKWAEHGPELIDIALTNWCDRACAVCYRSSSTRGRHMSVNSYRNILRQASKIGVLQVALGGGNPNQHPSFPDVLKMTREEYGVVPSYTTNGRGLTSRVLRASAAFCGAVAVSAHAPYDNMRGALRILVDAGVKTNVHFVLDASTVEIAIDWLRSPPEMLLGINGLVFLNYKPVGRASGNRRPLRESPSVPKFFDLASNHRHPFKVGFDSCLVSGLVALSRVNPVWFDGCEAARFSMFISEESLAFPCSFMQPTFRGVPVGSENLQRVWRRSRLFSKVRRRLLEPSCIGCRHASTCMGGCPLFPGINLCATPPKSPPLSFCSPLVTPGA